MATCERCQCSYSVHWGQHFCANDLPEQPKEFHQTRQVSKGVTAPKCDFWDRKAWLEHVLAPEKYPLSAVGEVSNWRKVAEGYREAAEARALVAQTEEALKQTVV